MGAAGSKLGQFKPKVTVDCVRKAALWELSKARREIAKLEEANSKLEEAETAVAEGAMKLKEFWENANEENAATWVEGGRVAQRKA